MGVAALRWQGRRHVVASMSRRKLSLVLVKLGLALSSPGGLIRGVVHTAPAVDIKEVVCEWAALGPSPNHQPSIQTRVGSVSHSPYRCNEKEMFQVQNGSLSGYQ